MRRNKIITVILISAASVFAGNSKILTKMGKFMPTVTESATLANTVNVYMKISDWVRATNTVIGNMRKAVQDIRNTKQAVEGIVSTAKSMKDFSLYDMDTWASTVDKSERIVGTGVNEILFQISCFEIHTKIAGMKYFDKLKDISEFDIVEQQKAKRIAVNSYFALGSHSQQALTILGLTEPQYLQQEIDKLELVKTGLARRIPDAGIRTQILKDSLIYVEANIVRYKRKLAIRNRNAVVGSKLDSIMFDASEMMALNLSEADIMQVAVKEFGDYVGELSGSIDRIKNNELPTAPGSPTASNEDITSDLEKIDSYGSHPNQAPTPKKAEGSGEMKLGNLDKKDANTQDIISIRNANNFTLLKQERILRDIEAMKANTLAYILVVDGYKRDEPNYYMGNNKFQAQKIKKELEKCN